MYFVSVTRLRLRSIFSFPAFFSANNGAVKQLLQTRGFMGGKELVDKGMIFWTITMWTGDADMRSFRNSEAHRKAMQRLPDWCSEATYAHWLQEDSAMPGWELVHEKMCRDGVVSKVRKPTERHLTKDFPPPRWVKGQRIFKGNTSSAA